jgi:ribosomal protein S27E
MVIGNEKRTSGRVEMVPLYAARIEDLGPGSFVKIDCAACSHTALLIPAFLVRLGLEPRQRVLDLKDRVRCRRCGVRGRAVVSIKWERMPRR